MKSKTILGADGATKMRQITVGIHGKGGEAGITGLRYSHWTIAATMQSWQVI